MGPHAAVTLMQSWIVLAIATIILFFVIELLPMPPVWKRITQGLLLLLAILAVLYSVLPGDPPPKVSPVPRLAPTPSIAK